MVIYMSNLIKYNNVIDAINIFNNKNVDVISLFNNNTVINNNIVRVYKCNNGALSIIKITNNRMYRVVGNVCIICHNIPNNWSLIGLFKGLTEGNIKALYHSLFNRSKDNFNEYY